MNLEKLHQLARKRESETLEFKASTNSDLVEAGMKTVCGILNAGLEGHVLFGVNDKGELRGIDIGANTLERLAAQVRRLEPLPDIHVDTIELPTGKSVVSVSFRKSIVLHTFGGVPYLRTSRATAQMPGPTYQRRLIEQANIDTRWEGQPASGFGVEDLDHDEILRTFEEAIRRQWLTDPGTRDPYEILVGLGLTAHGQILNAAMVLFGKQEVLQSSFPQCLLRLARFRGSTKSQFFDNRQHIGNAFQLYSRAQQFWVDRLPVAGRIVSGEFERIDEPTYPTEALREALANALCHRDYSNQGGGVDLAIYDDRLEITSTGPLHFGLSIEDLRQSHQSHLWNPLIARVFYLRGIIETWGRGTNRMIELLEHAGLNEPEFEDATHSFTVRFRATQYVPPNRVNANLSVLQKVLLQVLASHGPASLSKIISEMPELASERSVQDNLQMLRKLGLVEMTGQRKGARWSLKQANR